MFKVFVEKKDEEGKVISSSCVFQTGKISEATEFMSSYKTGESESVNLISDNESASTSSENSFNKDPLQLEKQGLPFAVCSKCGKVIPKGFFYTDCPFCLNRHVFWMRVFLVPVAVLLLLILIILIISNL